MKMDDSVRSTIEIIKIQEQDNETKLKEKREMEAIEGNLRRSIRDTILFKEKIASEQKQLNASIAKLRSQLQVEQIRKQALLGQVEVLRKEYNELQTLCDTGISKVWDLRSSLCKAVNSTSDQFDIWALLVKPICAEVIPRPVKAFNDVNIDLINESKFKSAQERLEKAIAERDRLQSEPDNGEEFLRIKNALQYSMKNIENMKRSF